MTDDYEIIAIKSIFRMQPVINAEKAENWPKHQISIEFFEKAPMSIVVEPDTEAQLYHDMDNYYGLMNDDDGDC